MSTHMRKVLVITTILFSTLRISHGSECELQPWYERMERTAFSGYLSTTQTTIKDTVQNLMRSSEAKSEVAKLNCLILETYETMLMPFLVDANSDAKEEHSGDTDIDDTDVDDSETYDTNTDIDDTNTEVDETDVGSDIDNEIKVGELDDVTEEESEIDKPEPDQDNTDNDKMNGDKYTIEKDNGEMSKNEDVTGHQIEINNDEPSNIIDNDKSAETADTLIQNKMYVNSEMVKNVDTSTTQKDTVSNDTMSKPDNEGLNDGNQLNVTEVNITKQIQNNICKKMLNHCKRHLKYACHHQICCTLEKILKQSLHLHSCDHFHITKQSLITENITDDTPGDTTVSQKYHTKESLLMNIFNYCIKPLKNICHHKICCVIEKMLQKSLQLHTCTDIHISNQTFSSNLTITVTKLIDNKIGITTSDISVWNYCLMTTHVKKCSVLCRYIKMLSKKRHKIIKTMDPILKDVGIAHDKQESVNSQDNKTTLSGNHDSNRITPDNTSNKITGGTNDNDANMISGTNEDNHQEVQETENNKQSHAPHTKTIQDEESNINELLHSFTLHNTKVESTTPMPFEHTKDSNTISERMHSDTMDKEDPNLITQISSFDNNVKLENMKRIHSSAEISQIKKENSEPHHNQISNYIDLEIFKALIDQKTGEYTSQIQSMENHVMRLENALLLEKLNKQNNTSSFGKLENQLLKVENEMLKMQHSYKELKDDNEHIKAEHKLIMSEMEGLARKNSQYLALPDNSAKEIEMISKQEEKIDELKHVVNNQSSFIDQLKNQSDFMEQQNRLLHQIVINQTMLVADMMKKMQQLTEDNFAQKVQQQEIKQKVDKVVDLATITRDRIVVPHKIRKKRKQKDANQVSYNIDTPAHTVNNKDKLYNKNITETHHLRNTNVCFLQVHFKSIVNQVCLNDYIVDNDIINIIFPFLKEQEPAYNNDNIIDKKESDSPTLPDVSLRIGINSPTVHKGDEKVKRRKFKEVKSDIKKPNKKIVKKFEKRNEAKIEDSMTVDIMTKTETSGIKLEDHSKKETVENVKESGSLSVEINLDNKATGTENINLNTVNSKKKPETVDLIDEKMEVSGNSTYLQQDMKDDTTQVLSLKDEVNCDSKQTKTETEDFKTHNKEDVGDSVDVRIAAETDSKKLDEGDKTKFDKSDSDKVLQDLHRVSEETQTDKNTNIEVTKVENTNREGTKVEDTKVEGTTIEETMLEGTTVESRESNKDENSENKEQLNADIKTHRSDSEETDSKLDTKLSVSNEQTHSKNTDTINTINETEFNITEKKETADNINQESGTVEKISANKEQINDDMKKHTVEKVTKMEDKLSSKDDIYDKQSDKNTIEEMAKVDKKEASVNVDNTLAKEEHANNNTPEKVTKMENKEPSNDKNDAKGEDIKGEKAKQSSKKKKQDTSTKSPKPKKPFVKPPILYHDEGHDDYKDCYDLYRDGKTTNGQQRIRMHTTQKKVQVDCDMKQGGWTVIQRRQDGKLDFFRDWKAYKKGFRDVYGEHWMGNDKLHILTNQDHYSLRVELTAWNKTKRSAEYNYFMVDSEQDGYRLHINGYSGDAGDGLGKHDMEKFSTKDMDNDRIDKELEGGSCAKRFKGAWWYYKCYASNLNGVYYKDGKIPPKLSDGVTWKAWTGPNYSLKKVVMMVRPAHAQSPGKR